MRINFQKFWDWYEKHKTLNLGIAAFLFTLQIAHLYWLTTHVGFLKLFGQSFFNPSPFLESILLFVDYLEIPAIIATSLVYINQLRVKFNYKSLWFLFFINSQWLHMLWVTDEFVLERFTDHTTTMLPIGLAWLAILIDYLELPVIIDTLKQFYKSLKEEGVEKAFESLKENENN